MVRIVKQRELLIRVALAVGTAPAGSVTNDGLDGITAASDGRINAGPAARAEASTARSL